jgi:hypothetical protein
MEPERPRPQPVRLENVLQTWASALRYGCFSKSDSFTQPALIFSPFMKRS